MCRNICDPISVKPEFLLLPTLIFFLFLFIIIRFRENCFFFFLLNRNRILSIKFLNQMRVDLDKSTNFYIIFVRIEQNVRIVE